jgi:hypothetical protein
MSTTEPRENLDHLTGSSFKHSTNACTATLRGGNKVEHFSSPRRAVSNWGHTPSPLDSLPKRCLIFLADSEKLSGMNARLDDMAGGGRVQVAEISAHRLQQNLKYPNHATGSSPCLVFV